MFTLNCRGRLLELCSPVVMGIINLTPDSFYAGSRKLSVDEVVDSAGKMIDDGAAILDLGGQSTRPGSDVVSADHELARVLEAITAIKKVFPNTFISIDTYYSRVAHDAVAEGADMVNDISSGQLDRDMISMVAHLKVPYIAMHMRGTPQTMQHFTEYEDVTLEVLEFFIKKTMECKRAGIQDIIIDPGFGFAKTIQQNFELLKKSPVLSILERPMLMGLSRKATVYKTLSITPDEALNGTTVLNTVALQKGASILRVHDVKEAIQAIKLYESVK